MLAEQGVQQAPRDRERKDITSLSKAAKANLKIRHASIWSAQCIRFGASDAMVTHCAMVYEVTCSTPDEGTPALHVARAGLECNTWSAALCT